MNCPFCGKEMKEGVIPNGFKWVEDGLDPTWDGGVRLTVGPLGKTPKSFFCPDCRQIILPVTESEGTMEFLERKLSAAGGKIEEVQKQWEARRAEKQKEKQIETRKKNLREKDPWEL